MASRSISKTDNPDGEAGPNAGSSHSGNGFYEVHVQGHLDNHWSDWLEGMEVANLDSGETILSGYIVDQAALMGILTKLNRLNLTLLSVNKGRKKE